MIAYGLINCLELFFLFVGPGKREGAVVTAAIIAIAAAVVISLLPCFLITPLIILALFYVFYFS